MRRLQIADWRFSIAPTAILVLVLGLSLVAAPLAAEAQQAQVPRIGVLSLFHAPDLQVEALKDGLRELGWIEGQSVRVEYRYADGQLDRVASLVAELIRLKVDVIVAGGEAGIRAARDATRTIPIVMANSGDPVGTGLVASLARPGSNMTGLSLLLPELGGKRLALLREAVPKASRVAVLWNSNNAAKPLEWKSTQAAAETLGVEVMSFEVREPADFASAFAAIVKARANALMPLTEPLTRTHRLQIGNFVVNNRLPMISEIRDFVDVGRLMSYGPSLLGLWRRAAAYVDKILRGAKPGDLPVEQPTTFELVINLKTAHTLGLAIPESVLFRADEVIR